jgi:hypothetical protein
MPCTSSLPLGKDPSSSLKLSAHPLITSNGATDKECQTLRTWRTYNDSTHRIVLKFQLESKSGGRLVTRVNQSHSFLPETSGLFIPVPPLFNRVHVLYFPKPIRSPTRGQEVACLDVLYSINFSIPLVGWAPASRIPLKTVRAGLPTCGSRHLRWPSLAFIRKSCIEIETARQARKWMRVSATAFALVAQSLACSEANLRVGNAVCLPLTISIH